MKKMRYLFLVLLALFTTFSFTACKCKNDDNKQSNEVQQPNFGKVGD